MSHWESLVDPRRLIPQSAKTAIERNPAAVDEPASVGAPKPAAPAKEVKPKRKPLEAFLEQRWERSIRREMLMLLLNGPIDRKAFRELAHQCYVKTGGTNVNGVSQAFDRLLAAGFIACEVKLTAKGFAKLGLKGPR